jgi:hypothetical protein
MWAKGVTKFIYKNPIMCNYVMTLGWTWTLVLILILTGQTTYYGQPSLFFVPGGIL